MFRASVPRKQSLASLALWRHARGDIVGKLAFLEAELRHRPREIPVPVGLCLLQPQPVVLRDGVREAAGIVRGLGGVRLGIGSLAREHARGLPHGGVLAAVWLARARLAAPPGRSQRVAEGVTCGRAVGVCCATTQMNTTWLVRRLKHVKHVAIDTVDVRMHRMNVWLVDAKSVVTVRGLCPAVVQQIVAVATLLATHAP